MIEKIFNKFSNYYNHQFSPLTQIFLLFVTGKLQLQVFLIMTEIFQRPRFFNRVKKV